MSPFDFTGKTVVVTGAALGFGKAIAEQFAALGARVHACDLQPMAFANQGEHPIQGAQFDLLDRRAATQWIRDVEAAMPEGIAVLVNNAGGVAGQAHAPLETVTDEDWDRVVDINLGTAFTLSRAVAAGMKDRGRGCIVNISSGAALQASLTGVQAYCASKHAVLGLTRQLAHELGPHGVRVNAVAPGFVITNAATQRQWDAMGADGQAALLRGIALRRLASPQDIANVTLWLASELAAMVNGQIISVDGGK
ncbi:SDR family NAD(P)-dependent oxidoreductase [Achromobacter deleyi]|uniref:SDR family NAD(P)-dependent oxidoreductase n=1 Tax=Achromobacter deleyi TaxID=1353891 RepID=UPI0014917EBF|nr:SDR family NAD(P)-dependent oxidoreductase [Achromobacter deleyi]QVQ27110.1 SDR family oxidoreductase [Achromobacter deleyi]UIP22697.1 SDR family oxidoreductase [Achromobacter deleyi]